MKYEKIKYPDGQISVKILDGEAGDMVSERINSYEDLFFVKSIAEAANAQKNQLRLFMCMGQKESEIQTFKRLLKLYPKNILSVVSDTWDLWYVLTVILPAIKEEILARDGKLVIRPDSGDPVDILCGKEWDSAQNPYDENANYIEKGVIELLWDLFGGTYVTGQDGKQYKQLDSHIGAIYGDSITLDRARQICERLKAKGFASTNVVLGIGSYTYQYNTRDTFGFAVKATYGEVTRKELAAHGPGVSEWDTYVERREIWKDPITDDGTKKSKKGLLHVYEISNPYLSPEEQGLRVKDQCTWEEEGTGLLTTVFKDGKLVKRTTLEEIRKRLN